MKLNFAQKIGYKFIYLFKYLYHFRIPNLSNIFSKKIVFSKLPVFNILTIVSGNGKLHIGKNCVLGSRLGGFYKYGSIEFITRDKNASITLGDEIWTNNNLSILCYNKINIGSKCLIGQNVLLMDFEAHKISPETRKEIGSIGSIFIGENVWIGNNVIILKNTIIGENSIVAAGAIVSGEFPQNVIIGGVPAKIIKHIDSAQ